MDSNAVLNAPSGSQILGERDNCSLKLSNFNWLANGDVTDGVPYNYTAEVNTEQPKKFYDMTRYANI